MTDANQNQNAEKNRSELEPSELERFEKELQMRKRKARYKAILATLLVVGLYLFYRYGLET